MTWGTPPYRSTTVPAECAYQCAWVEVGAPTYVLGPFTTSVRALCGLPPSPTSCDAYSLSLRYRGTGPRGTEVKEPVSTRPVSADGSESPQTPQRTVD